MLFFAVALCILVCKDKKSLYILVYILAISPFFQKTAGSSTPTRARLDFAQPNGRTQPVGADVLIRPSKVGFRVNPMAAHNPVGAIHESPEQPKSQHKQKTAEASPRSTDCEVYFVLCEILRLRLRMTGSCNLVGARKLRRERPLCRSAKFAQPNGDSQSP